MILYKILILIAITLIPALELRASIPVGILEVGVPIGFGHTIQGLGLPWLLVFVVCVLANIALGLVFYAFLETIVHFMHRFRFFRRTYERVVNRIHRKIHNLVDKYGEWAVMVFIAIPIPGSGVIGGSIASEIIGLEYRKFIVSCILGVLIAGVIVTTVTLSAAGVFGI